MAVRNLSSSATTVKSQYNLLSADSWNIDRTLMYCNYDNAAIIQDEIILDKYMSYFSTTLIEVDVDEKYYYSPHLFASDYYGDPGLYFIVLYFANMTSIFDFNKPKITVLPYERINDLNKLFSKYRKEVDANKKNPPLYNSSDMEDIKTHASYLEK